jgi:pre-mRNA-processing factor 6
MAEEKAEDAKLNDSKYDEFSGYQGSLFDATPYDEDDEAADRVWDEIDAHMDERRKSRREQRIAEQLSKFRSVRPKLQHQFSDLKRDLGHVTHEEWDNLPEPGAHTKHAAAEKRNERYIPVPDTLLDKARQEQEMSTSLDDKQMQHGGMETPMPGGGAGSSSTPLTDLKSIGEARGAVLSVKLDQMSDSVGGQTVVDPKGYLTDLNSVAVSTEAEIGDIKKARLLLKSVTQTNPGHGPGWIAAARLEEVAGKLVAARQIIREGCRACPASDDVWLEAARLQTPENAKTILAEAVKKIPQSVKIWIHAASLETSVAMRRRVLRKALEVIPNSVKLWQAAIDLEGPDDARLMLGRAVECVPHSVDMWLALARLETYQNARKVLNKARETIPTEPQIWMTASKLEEANGNLDLVDRIIEKAIKSLTLHQVHLEREQWLAEAEAAEKGGAPRTAQAIIKETLSMGVEEEDRKRIWLEDAESFVSRGCPECGRAVYAQALTVFPTKKSVWLKAAQHEKRHGTAESLDALLRKAVSFCPHAEALWLMGAKEKWLNGSVEDARQILIEAFRANPDSEQVWLAAVKLESENNQPDAARSLLSKARERAGTERVWMKSVLLERNLGQSREALALIGPAIKAHPRYWKLLIMKAQLEQQLEHVDAARETLSRAVRVCADCVPLWLEASRLEERSGLVSKARSLLEVGRLKNVSAPQLWLEAVRLERRAGNKKAAATLMSKALQQCRTAGQLWAEAISMEQRAQQKTKSSDALKACDNDPHVILAVSRLFWRDRKEEKARSWCNRAVTLDPALGDAWANYYAFELQHGTEEQQAEVLRRCLAADPHHGDEWTTVSKDVRCLRWSTEQIVRRVAASMALGKYAPEALEKIGGA